MEQKDSYLLVDKINKWFISDGFNISEPNNMQNDIITILNDSGFEIIRSHIFLNTLHPQVGFEIFRWYKKNMYTEVGVKSEIKEKRFFHYDEGNIENVKVSHLLKNYDIFKNSPLYDVLQTNKKYRYIFKKNETSFKYSILKDFYNFGATDYLIMPLDYSFYNKYGVVTWVTNKKEGFSEDDLFVLDELSKTLSIYLRSYLEKQLTKILLSTYLGESTGKKVLNGQITRGNIEKIEAAVWFSDLRNFTTLSNKYDTGILIEWLNEYFDLISISISENNGEILKFIGDAVLAIFPVSEKNTKESSCQDALKAAVLANKKLEELNILKNEKNQPELMHGIGLHFGLVEYGNIGASERLDFTVIGPTVNLTSRIESLCSKLGKQTLISENFSSLCNSKSELLGEYELKGFNEVQKIFTPY